MNVSSVAPAFDASGGFQEVCVMLKLRLSRCGRPAEDLGFEPWPRPRKYVAAPLDQAEKAEHMAYTDRVKEILGWYPSDNPGTKTQIARLLTTGALAGTGKLVILPVDQ